MIHGYIRVSTAEQRTGLQRRELEKAGVERLWVERGSGVAMVRPVLHDLLDSVEPGDTIMVWRLDRLGRSMVHLVDTVNTLHERDVSVCSLHEQFDTRTANGRLQLGLFALLAQFERDLMKERTMAGLAAAKASGKRVGRPPKITADRTKFARELAAQQRSVADIARLMGVSRATVYRMLADEISPPPPDVANDGEPSTDQAPLQAVDR